MMQRQMPDCSTVIRTSASAATSARGRLPTGPAAQDSLFQLSLPVPGRDLISGANQIRTSAGPSARRRETDPQHPSTTPAGADYHGACEGQQTALSHPLPGRSSGFPWWPLGSRGR